MKTASKLVAAATFALVLTSCSGGQRGPRFKPGVINRALATAPGEAQPSAVVATEVAMAQAEKDEGVWKAQLKYAAPGAVWHVSDGTLDVASTVPFLKELDDTAEWSTRTVVMSCDGALAVAMGRFLNIQKKYGDYLTVWVRQSDSTYKWSYTTEWIDDPQPPPRPQADDNDSLITVTAFDAIQGLVASCPSADSPVPPPPALSLANEHPAKAQLSKDGTLRWRWEDRPGDRKHVVVEYWYEGEWVTAIEEGLASPRDQ